MACALWMLVTMNIFIPFPIYHFVSCINMGFVYAIPIATGQVCSPIPIQLELRMCTFLCHLCWATFLQIGCRPPFFYYIKEQVLHRHCSIWYFCCARFGVCPTGIICLSSSHLKVGLFIALNQCSDVSTQMLCRSCYCYSLTTLLSLLSPWSFFVQVGSCPQPVLQGYLYTVEIGQRVSVGRRLPQETNQQLLNYKHSVQG